MIDLVYPLKENGSRLGDWELRYSLRSVERHLKLDLGRLWIFGYQPSWLSPDVHVRMVDKGDKAMNLRAKYARMVEHVDISDPFLLLDDDHIFLKDATIVPAVTKGVLVDLVRKYQGTAHGRYLRFCLDQLIALGLPTRNYQIHYPMLIEKAVLGRAVAAMRKPMVMGSIYGNMVNGPTEELKQDYRMNTEQEFLALKDGPFISLPPRSSPQAVAFVSSRFPAPSRWEIEEAAVVTG